MYAVIEWTESNGSNIVNDIAAVLTGTTDVNTLSSHCNKSNSSILTTYASAGWSMYDDQSGSKVVRAALVDDSETYKYLHLYGLGASQYAPNCFLYRLWDNNTHTGTDVATGGSIPGPAYTYVPRCYISASARHFLIFGEAIGVGVIYGSYGIFEFRRTSPWDTVTYGATKAYIPVVSGSSWHTMGSGSGGYIPAAVREYDQARLTNQLFKVATPYGSDAQLPVAVGNSFELGKTWAWVDDELVESYKLIPFGVGGSLGLPYHEISTLCGGIWYLTPGWKNHLSEFVHPEDDRTYVCWQVSSTVAMAVPKG